MPAVDVDKLVVSYGQKVAVDGVSFQAEYGEVTVVIGPNGAGKTSTIECCEGFRTPNSGSVRVGGHDPIRAHAKVVRQMGVMIQGGALMSAARPLETLRQFAAFYPDPLDPKELLERVGLGGVATTNWRQLSGGEQQRLSLGLALVGRPSVVFLDEPSAGVDVEGRLLIREVLKELRNDGVAVVLTTHDLDDGERSADRIVIIDHGKVIANGTPAELLERRAHAVSFSARPGLDTFRLGAVVGVTIEEVQPGNYRAATGGTPQFVAELTAALAEQNVEIDEIRVGKQRLDDLFLTLTTERSTAEIPVIRPPKRTRS